MYSLWLGYESRRKSPRKSLCVRWTCRESVQAASPGQRSVCNPQTFHKCVHTKVTKVYKRAKFQDIQASQFQFHTSVSLEPWIPSSRVRTRTARAGNRFFSRLEWLLRVAVGQDQWLRDDITWVILQDVNLTWHCFLYHLSRRKSAALRCLP